MDFKEKYFQIWKEVWEFHKKWYSINGSEEAWENALAQSSKIFERHKGKETESFVKALILVVLDEIERRCRNERNE